MSGSAFYKGQQLGRNDLSIFLDNVNGTPENAAEISYALYDFTTGREVLVGAPRRQPVNPSLGEYFASIIVPLDANLGEYRIRWTFREMPGAPIQQVLMNFSVIDKVNPDSIEPTLTSAEQDMGRRLRILLRDNCVGEEETIEVDVSGENMVVSIRDLYEAIHGTS
jgi:hypothetical protein